MKTEFLEKCPACESNQIEKQVQIKDHYYSQEVFEVWNCKGCGLHFTQNRPTAEEIGRYYDSENYASHDSGKKKSAFLKIYQTARDYMLGQKAELIRRFKPEWKTVLDYGTGEGFFTEFCLSKGKTATGIEPSEAARQNFKNRTGKELLADVSQLKDRNHFDVITLWHVLEHIHDLKGTMSQLVEALEKLGIMVIAVPNNKSQDLKHFGKYWAAWDVPRHLYHWDPKSLELFMNGLGMKRIHTTHLPLDPIYIGMISARYAGNNSLSGIWTGIKSYFHGKSHPDEGSTLLTVWMKK